MGAYKNPNTPPEKEAIPIWDCFFNLIAGVGGKLFDRWGAGVV